MLCVLCCFFFLFYVILQKSKSESCDEIKTETKLDDDDDDDVTTNGTKIEVDNDKNDDGKDIKDGNEKKEEMDVVPMQQNFGVYPKKQEREYDEEEVSTLLNLFDQGQKAMDSNNSTQSILN